MALIGLAVPGAARATSGDLDPSFSNYGFLVTSFGPLKSTNERANAVTLDQQGRIVVAGSTSKGNDFAVLRYHPDGTRDSSWSFDGRVRTDFGGNDGAAAVAVDDQGRVVVAGSTVDSSGHVDFAVARYMPRGRLDASFSGDGRTTTDWRISPGALADAGANALAIDSLGRIVVTGSVDTGESGFAVARYLSDGNLDPSLSGDGTTDFIFDESSSDNLDTAYAVATDLQDRIVLAGRADNDFAVARLAPNGSLDPTFSSDGKTITNFLGGISGIGSITFDSHNRIVAAGRGYYANDSGDPTDTWGFALARYLPDGSLDSTFSPKGVAGTLTRSVGSDHATAHWVGIDSLGRIVVVGESVPGGMRERDDFAIARFMPSGLPDTTFSGDGQVTTHIGAQYYPTAAFSGAIDAQGRIIAAGMARGSVDIAVARYLGDG